jgi:DNA-binding beta-propeller fold protein YncE
VYVANSDADGPNAIWQFTTGIAGALTADTPPSVHGGYLPTAIAVTPNGHFVYVVNDQTDGPGGISQYRSARTGPGPVFGGVLTPDRPATVKAGFAPHAIAVSPNGQYVYVVNGNTNGPHAISQYSIGKKGVLKPDAVPTAPSGDQPENIVISPNGMYAYVTYFGQGQSGAGGIAQYRIGAGGMLKPDATPLVKELDGPSGLAISPSGRHVYVTNDQTNGAGGVSQYTVASTGMLKLDPQSSVIAGDGPTEIALSPGGLYAYVTNYTTDGAGGVSQYTVGADGRLTPDPMPTAISGDNPDGIVVAGQYVYVACVMPDLNCKGVAEYTIGAGGMLFDDVTDSVAAGDSPIALAVAR